MLVLTQIYTLPLKVYVFSGEKDQTPIKISSPSDLPSQNALATVSSKFHIQNNVKGAY